MHAERPRRLLCSGGVSFLLAALLALPASAGAPPSAPSGLGGPSSEELSSGIDLGFLNGVGPVPVAGPIARPYFLGWSTPIARPPALLKTANEPGGIAVDPRTGWVYAATRDGRVVCLDGGTVRWEVEVGGALLSAPAVTEDSVVAGTAEGVLAILNKVTGERRARAILGEELITQPVVVTPRGGTPRAYVGSSMDSLFAVDLQYGQKLWRAHRDQPGTFTIHGFARPVVLGDTVFAGFSDGTLEALDAASGQVKWEKALSPKGDLMDVDALATNESLLFAASYTGGVYALNPADGAIVWHTPMSGATRLKVDGPNVVAVAPGVMQDLRASDGKVLWRFTFGTSIALTPVITEHTVVLTEEDGPMFFVDEHTGAPIGEFDPGSGFEAAPAVTGQILFALSNGGRVYSMSVVR